MTELNVTELNVTKTDVIEHDTAVSVAAAADAAVRAIPPAWPLTATVAVNPFLGQTLEPRDQTAARLARVAGVRLALPRRHSARKVEAGNIGSRDLADALAANPQAGHLDLAALKDALRSEPLAPQALPTIADLCARASAKDWPGLVADRIGAFCGGYFDEGQALWAASRRASLYAAWRAYAMQDLTPEILGLSGFGRHVAETPETAIAAIERAVLSLGFETRPGLDDTLTSYFHQLLVTLGGWAQFARHLHFTAERDGSTDTTTLDLLAIRLVFEEALHARHAAEIGAEWTAARQAHAAPLTVDDDVVIDGVLQAAAERATQRRLSAVLTHPIPASEETERPVLQAAFCIDVRSEVFRRALESLDPGIRTLGFAGFFGLGIRHNAFASDVPEHRMPVLLRPSNFTCSAPDEPAGAAEDGERKARFSARTVRAWGRFRLAAVSSFAFVEAMGPVYAGKLLRDGLGFGKAAKPDNVAPRFAAGLDLATRVTTAESVLRAMSLTSGFAPCVLIVGHGASVVNNPAASALQCGACGGHAGDVNARLLAALLNEQSVRNGLEAKGLHIPADTVFLGALHDTTTDAITLFDDDIARDSPAENMGQIRNWLAQAGQLTRAERAQRLPRATAASVAARSRDWSETRAELGLANCRAFIAAPRSRTRGRSLEGQAFLHDYVWQQDKDFRILELILTAPVVVASWISLQYFGSVVAPSLFGSGNKLLHNVVGGIGVVEGNGGLLRAGLPWQSVHDGVEILHEPLRLTVAIDAPREAITAILARHPQLRALFDNGWLSLFALGADGSLAWRYDGALGWTWNGERAEVETAAQVPLRGVA
jgi:uncharacterized protein YbcC (UPF0753/DUF2309 family)